MISRCGLTSWMRLPTAVYIAAISVPGPVPQVGVRTRPPTRDRLGSFMMSIPATSGSALYRSAIDCQAAKNFAAGQRSLNHMPLSSRSEQHQPASRVWQLGMTIRPAPVSASTQAS